MFLLSLLFFFSLVVSSHCMDNLSNSTSSSLLSTTTVSPTNLVATTNLPASANWELVKQNVSHEYDDVRLAAKAETKATILFSSGLLLL